MDAAELKRMVPVIKFFPFWKSSQQKLLSQFDHRRPVTDMVQEEEEEDWSLKLSILWKAMDFESLWVRQ